MGLWISVEIEQKVRRLLRRKRLSQRTIASRVGISRGTVSSIATGRIGWPARGIKVRQRPRISRAELVDFQATDVYRCENGHSVSIQPCPICLAQRARERRLAVR